LSTDAAPLSAKPSRLVLYDGHCGMCDATVQWFIAHDPGGKFHFAPLQGPTAAQVLERHPELPENLDSIVFVVQTPDGERVFWESRAFLLMCGELENFWRVLRWFMLIPAFISDPVYRFVARHRLKVFGSLDSCRIPSPAQAEHFLP
jgi:predicted DCC family thiol-disulfide oxidoreductase YuxK